MHSNDNKIITQEAFLKSLTESKASVFVYLTSGIKLYGSIACFDQHSIILSGRAMQLIYKHAISTIVVGDNASLALDKPLKKTNVITKKSIKTEDSHDFIN